MEQLSPEDFHRSWLDEGWETKPLRWTDKAPTVEQIRVLKDRNIRTPRTRGEAATIIGRIAVEEGWYE